MEKIININKPIGLTPLQLIQKFKNKFKIYKNIPISHAGKLDPLAEGVTLLIAGNEIKNIKKYMKLDKTYQAKILFGFSTDSYDIQGIAKKHNKNINEKELLTIINNLKGDYLQTIPPYSGRIINKKPLFYWARTNQLNKIKIPQETININKIKLNNITKINSKELLNNIIKKINLLDGDFRQDIIIKNWEKILNNINEEYCIADIAINCSSGTYIRAIANDLGKKLNSGAILFHLTRTKIGKYKLFKSLKI